MGPCAAAVRSMWASGLSLAENGPFLRLKVTIAVPTCGTGQAQTPSVDAVLAGGVDLAAGSRPELGLKLTAEAPQRGRGEHGSYRVEAEDGDTCRFLAETKKTRCVTHDEFQLLTSLLSADCSSVRSRHRPRRCRRLQGLRSSGHLSPR